MNVVEEMIDSKYRNYLRYLKREKDVQHVFLRLWEDCFAKDPDEDILVLNIIVSKMSLVAGQVDITAKYSIKNAMLNYEKMKDKLKIYYSEEDNKIIDDMVAEINSQQDIWKM